MKNITNEDLILIEKNKRLELSRQQEHIIKLMCEGKTNGEIAEMLCISYKTLKNHLSVLYKKLSVQNKTEAVLVWIQYQENYKIETLERIIIEKNQEIAQLKKIIYELRK